MELENIDGNVAKGDEEKRRMRDEYEQKVALVQTQLQKLKSERTAGETLRLEKERQSQPRRCASSRAR